MEKIKAKLCNSDIKCLSSFVKGMPKAELHVHIEGTLEPSMMLKIAKRNGLTEDPRWKQEFEYNGDDTAWIDAEIIKRSNFKNLNDFLQLYYKACVVLKTEQKRLLINFG